MESNVSHSVYLVVKCDLKNSVLSFFSPMRKRKTYHSASPALRTTSLLHLLWLQADSQPHWSFPSCSIVPMLVDPVVICPVSKIKMVLSFPSPAQKSHALPPQSTCHGCSKCYLPHILQTPHSTRHTPWEYSHLSPPEILSSSQKLFWYLPCSSSWAIPRSRPTFSSK